MDLQLTTSHAAMTSSNTTPVREQASMEIVFTFPRTCSNIAAKFVLSAIAKQ